MARYLDAFFRHPLLMVAPIVLAFVAALTYAAAQPKTYQATETVFFSTAQPSDSTGNPVQPDTSSATKAVAVFQEYLKTRAFDLQVGRDGKLADYYSKNNPSATGLGGVLRHAFSKVGLASYDSSMSGGALDDQVASAVSSGIVATAAGPQIVQLVATAPSADSAAGIANAAYKAFSAQVVAARQQVLNNDVNTYKRQQDTAKKDATDADNALITWINAHPVPRGEAQLGESCASSDIQCQNLQVADQAARTRLQSASSHLFNAQQALAESPSNPGFSVQDAATPPADSVSAARKTIISLIGGIFIGILLMLCVLVLITSADRTLRNPADVERVLGIRAGGYIPRVRKLASWGSK